MPMQALESGHKGLESSKNLAIPSRHWPLKGSELVSAFRVFSSIPGLDGTCKSEKLLSLKSILYPLRIGVSLGPAPRAQVVKSVSLGCREPGFTLPTRLSGCSGKPPETVRPPPLAQGGAALPLFSQRAWMLTASREASCLSKNKTGS